jgi:carbon monoxide dehydrogenase subunit G
MLRFEGSKDLPRAPAEVWNKLSDARFLVQCVPGVESVARAERTSVVCTLRPGFAFVRGTLELSLQVVDAVPDTSARLLLQTKGIGTTSEVEARWSVQPQGSGSRLTWSAEIKSLGGLLKAVPQGLIKAAAQKVIDDALATVAAKLAAEPETS